MYLQTKIECNLFLSV